MREPKHRVLSAPLPLAPTRGKCPRANGGISFQMVRELKATCHALFSRVWDIGHSDVDAVENAADL